MEKIIIEGNHPLKGEVSISGAKNSALPILSAALLAETPSRIKNIPCVKDVETMLKIISSLGAKVERKGDMVQIDPTTLSNPFASYEFVSTMRASICLLGPLLTKKGRAKISLPGGCAIGPRPIDLHLKGLKKLGAKIEIEKGYIIAYGKLKGDNVDLKGPFGSSVLATANIMMAACLAEGKTTIFHSAQEPEIVDLANFLNKMGGKIKGAGERKIEIKGVKALKGTEYTIIPDRIEAITYAIAAIITKGEIEIKNIIPEHLTFPLKKLKQTGAKIHLFPEKIRVGAKERPRPLHLTTAPYPGLPTDIQPMLTALLCLCEGKSVVKEAIYPHRFLYTGELQRMGANIIPRKASIIINGVKQLKGAKLMASDIRAGASLVLAGLSAKGETTISRIYHIDRGYERLTEKLSTLGAKIKREPEKTPPPVSTENSQDLKHYVKAILTRK